MCDSSGPKIGRLVSHETSEEGNTSAVTKIKVELIDQSQNQSATVSGRLSPFPKVDSPLSAVRVGFQRVDSGDTTTAARASLQSRSKVLTGDRTEIWDVSNVVFLESESKVLGKVVTVDGPHVIVRVTNVSSQSESSLRVFKVSELETVIAESANTQGTSFGGQASSSLIYRGCIQHEPKCIVNAERPTPPPSVKEEVLTGLRPVALATTEAGVNLLVQRTTDGKAFFLGSVTDTDNDNSRVFTSVVEEGVVAESDGSVTVEAESVMGEHAALTMLPWQQAQSSEGTQKRKLPLEDDDLAENASSEMNSACESHFMKPCQVTIKMSGCPSLHSLPVNNLVLLCDGNGCLYKRSFNTKLSVASYLELVPLKCFSTSQRMGHVISSENSEQRVLVMFVG